MKPNTQLPPSSKAELTCIAHIHAGKIPSGKITVAGWVRTRRSSKKITFLEITDGSHAKGLQVVIDVSLPNYETEISHMHTGCSVQVWGNLVDSPGQGQAQELCATKVTLIGNADPESFPLQKKEMTFEYLREVAHMRPRTATFASVFRIRSHISMAIHQFFHAQDFFYVHTPILTTSDGEGAGETFKVTNLPLEDFNKLPKVNNKSLDFSKDFFGEPTMLCVTGQLEGELMAMGLGKVYTFGPTFRAENSNTSRHLAEFWMIEPEMAFWNITDTMELGEKLIKHVAAHVLNNCADDLEILAKRGNSDSRPHLKTALSKDFIRISYTEAIAILNKADKKFEFPFGWGLDLKSEHERYLCEEYFQSPTTVYNYPEELKAFYMLMNDDNRTVAAMDVLVPGIGEVIGGSQREDREEYLRQRMVLKGLSPQHLDWYLASRRFGTVPHSGFGLGLERLCMWITGMANIRDVVPFPRTPGNCKF